MKQKFLGGLTAAVVVSTFGASLPSSAQQSDDLSDRALAEASAFLRQVGAVDKENSVLSDQGITANAIAETVSTRRTQSESRNESKPQVAAVATAAPKPQDASASDEAAAPQVSDEAETATAEFIEEDAENVDLDSANEGADEVADFTLAANSEAVGQVHAHTLDALPAATLYVRNIPVLTFLGEAAVTNSEASSDSDSAAGSAQLAGSDHLVEVSQPESETGASAPAARATAIAALLHQLTQEGFDPGTIQVRWDDEQEHYLIEAADMPLAVFEDHTILPDTTGEPAQDALQAANRLRRLLGNEPPLTEIINQPEPEVPAVLVRASMSGAASWYGPGFHGRRSASGEVFNQNALTAAHRTLPFGTQVRVTNLATSAQVVVRINDRGPFSHGRIIDLSAAAAREIGLYRMGVAPVRVEVLEMAQ
ncbi:MAG: septal ring lytic transglycosylase RlpA family protein [Cyanobacteria bacterium P01_H01_bin.119]